MRIHVHIAPKHREECTEESKEQSVKIAQLIGILGLSNFRIGYYMPPPYQQTLCKGCTKENLTQKNP